MVSCFFSPGIFFRRVIPISLFKRSWRLGGMNSQCAGGPSYYDEPPDFPIDHIQDDSKTFWVEIKRRSDLSSTCDTYILHVSNGFY